MEELVARIQAKPGLRQIIFLQMVAHLLRGQHRCFDCIDLVCHGVCAGIK